MLKNLFQKFSKDAFTRMLKTPQEHEPANLMKMVLLLLTVILPTSIIGPIRYTISKDDERTRLKYLAQDVSAIGIGGGIQMLIMHYLEKTLRKTVKGIPKRAPLLTAFAGVVGGIGNYIFQAVPSVYIKEMVNQFFDGGKASASVMVQKPASTLGSGSAAAVSTISSAPLVRRPFLPNMALGTPFSN